MEIQKFNMVNRPFLVYGGGPSAHRPDWPTRQAEVGAAQLDVPGSDGPKSHAAHAYPRVH
jgi:hypothetical protein